MRSPDQTPWVRVRKAGPDVADVHIDGPLTLVKKPRKRKLDPVLRNR